MIKCKFNFNFFHKFGCPAREFFVITCFNTSDSFYMNLHEISFFVLDDETNFIFELCRPKICDISSQIKFHQKNAQLTIHKLTMHVDTILSTIVIHLTPIMYNTHILTQKLANLMTMVPQKHQKWSQHNFIVMMIIITETAQ